MGLFVFYYHRTGNIQIYKKNILSLYCYLVSGVNVRLFDLCIQCITVNVWKEIFHRR